ncbi:hypothetical protein [Reyranella sp.]|uniref:hypothetical protein n=1 Tax=Reyranella sp. TaxID=1929291 RepID=UPI0037841291
MRRPALLLTAVFGLSLVACERQQPSTSPQQPQSPSSPQDLAYCAKLTELYQRYVGPDPNSANMAGVRPDVQGGEAVAKCREGDARASIPTLERLLKDADITLPPRA